MKHLRNGRPTCGWNKSWDRSKVGIWSPKFFGRSTMFWKRLPCGFSKCQTTPKQWLLGYTIYNRSLHALIQQKRAPFLFRSHMNQPWYGPHSLYRYAFSGSLSITGIARRSWHSARVPHAKHVAPKHIPSKRGKYENTCGILTEPIKDSNHRFRGITSRPLSSSHRATHKLSTVATSRFSHQHFFLPGSIVHTPVIGNKCFPILIKIGIPLHDKDLVQLLLQG